MKSETLMLLLYVFIQGLFAFGVWQLAIYVHPIQQEMEILDLEIQLENCHWQLLERNAELETLKNRK